MSYTDTCKRGCRYYATSFPKFSLFFGAAGYFVYGGLEGFLAAFILTFTLGIVGWIGVVPFPVGPALYLWLAPKVVQFVFGFTGIGQTRSSQVIYWFEFAGALIVSIIALVFLLFWWA